MRSKARHAVGVVALLVVATLGGLGPASLPQAEAATYTPITSPSACPSAAGGGRVIDFNDAGPYIPLAERYRDQGVRFVDDAKSTPVGSFGRFIGDWRLWLMPDDGASSAGRPLRIRFDELQKTVGLEVRNTSFYEGSVTATMTVRDTLGRPVASTTAEIAPDNSKFIGIAASSATIATVTLDYGASNLGEDIDGLCFGGLDALRMSRRVVLLPAPKVRFLPDLWLRGFEVTQAVQCWDQFAGLKTCGDNTAGLVTRKTSLLRVYGGTSATTPTPNVPYRVYLTAAGKSYQWDASGPAMPKLSRLLKDSANLSMQAKFKGSMNVSMYAVVDPDNVIAESNENNNRIPATGSVSLSFRHTNDRLIVGRIVDYHRGGSLRKPSGAAVNGSAADWFEAITPSSDGGIDYEIASGELEWPGSSSGAEDAHALIKRLNKEWIWRTLGGAWGSGGARHYYGWISSPLANAMNSLGHADMPVYPHAGGLGIVGFGVDTPGSGIDAPGAGETVFGHEVAHDYNLLHPSTADSCGSQDNDTDWPYSNAKIQEFGVNPLTSKLYDPASTYDVMSYCPPALPGWISPFHWNKLHQSFTSGTGQPSAAAVTPAAAADGIVMVDVTIDAADVVQFRPAYRQADGTPFNPVADPTSPYAVELRAGTTVLAREPFRVSRESESGGVVPHADVLLSMPFDATATSVAVTKNGAVLAQRPVTASAPQVTVAALPASFDPGTTQTISWSGADADGDALTYTVLYSIDNTRWDVLASDLTATSMTVQTDSLAGSEGARFRVVATDGVNTGSDDSDGVAVPDQLPIVQIMSPAGGARTGVGTSILLRATATDREEGSVADAAIAWSSDRQGALGTGATLTVDSLTPGRHTISVRAYQFDGRFAERTVIVDVVGLDVPVLWPDPSGAGEQTAARATITSPFGVEGLRCTVDYGEGAGDEAGTISGRTCAGPGHTYPRVGSYPVIVKVLDGERELAIATGSALVVDKTAPTVTIVRGAKGGLYLADAAFIEGGSMPVMAGSVTIEATASDPDSPVAKLEFFVDDVPVAASRVRYDAARNVWSFVYRGGVPGLHTIKARATNAYGLSGDAQTQALTVGV